MKLVLISLELISLFWGSINNIKVLIFGDDLANIVTELEENEVLSISVLGEWSQKNCTSPFNPPLRQNAHVHMPESPCEQMVH